jgi:hypothetical protein
VPEGEGEAQVKVHPVTLAELRSRQADYALKAERALAERNVMSGGASKLLFTKSNTAKMWAARADDYARLIKVAELISDNFADALITTEKQFDALVEGTDGSSPA